MQRRIRHWKRWWWGLNGAMVLCGVCAAVILQTLRPPLTTGWQAIYQGVDLWVQPIPPPWGEGRMMAVRVRWDTPGIILQHRNPDFPLPMAGWQQSQGDRLYRLTLADWALQRQHPAILVNTTRYLPAESWRSLPGRPVATAETLVIKGQASHREQDNYLLWWDQAGMAQLERTKPPSLQGLQTAVLGMGVQAVSIFDGQVNYGARSPIAEPIPRTFIGIDNASKSLYLIAFEKISDVGMTEMAIALGVKDGAMVDSGDATHLLIGDRAQDVLSHAGIRNRRPLAGYLMIFAEPLPQ